MVEVFAAVFEQVVVGFENRLRVLPGLTGLAQVYDPTDNAHDKLRYDFEYLRTMSPWLDMKLLLLSVRNTLWVKWDRRSGKPAETDGITESLSQGGR